MRSEIEEVKARGGLRLVRVVSEIEKVEAVDVERSTAAQSWKMSSWIEVSESSSSRTHRPSSADRSSRRRVGHLNAGHLADTLHLSIGFRVRHYILFVFLLGIGVIDASSVSLERCWSSKSSSRCLSRGEGNVGLDGGQGSSW